MFVNALQNELNCSTLKRTENGALGYATSGSKLVDLNFAVSSLRNKAEIDIVNMFKDAYYEDPKMAIAWLFFVRDIRGGLGERRTFRIILKNLATVAPCTVTELIPLIAEYGRWDDVLELMPTHKIAVLDTIEKQLKEDINNMKANKSISLLAKWLPSENASSYETKRMAATIRKDIGLTSRVYRKTLSRLRAYLRVVERDMSANRWNEINYETVPSRANLLYKEAFKRHDGVRYNQYLNQVTKGEAKINAGTLFPHDIVNKYSDGGYYYGYYVRNMREDPAIEALWNNLPDFVNGDNTTLVVADGSGSMTCRVNLHSNVSALDVANGLAIYFAERAKGEFKDTYITFSSRPQLVNLKNASSLCQKLEIARRHREVAFTNIEATFDLILRTAANNKMAAEDLPKNILIISDMEFNTATSWSDPNKTLFKNIEHRFNIHGYTLPRLIFWNVDSRTNTIPVQQNEAGVALVSGFSPSVVKMVLSGKTDPYDVLVETLTSKRYAPIWEVLDGTR